MYNSSDWGIQLCAKTTLVNLPFSQHLVVVVHMHRSFQVVRAKAERI